MYHSCFSKSVSRTGVARLVAFLALATIVQLPSTAQPIGPFPSGVLAKTIDFVRTPGGSSYAVVGTQSYGVYRADPGEPSSSRWMASNVGLPQPLVVNAVEYLATGDLLIGTTGWGGLFVSRDGGASWEVVPSSSFGNRPVYAVSTITESTTDGATYIGTDDGSIMVSRNGGASWTLAGRMPGGAAQFPTALVSHPMRARVLYAGTAGLGVLVSTDDGSNWAMVPSNTVLTAAGAGHVFKLLFDPDHPDRLFAATARGVWRWETNVASSGWQLVGASEGTTRIRSATGEVSHVNPEVRSIAWSPGGPLYAATSGHGVLQINEPVTGSEFAGLSLGSGVAAVVAVSPEDELMVSTQGGFIVRPNASGVGTEYRTEIPRRVQLHQNYPNPFNPETTITFDLPTDSRARLAVFDVTGREMLRPIDGLLSAGRHEVAVGKHGWPSGLYLYRLMVDGESSTRVMTLLR